LLQVVTRNNLYYVIKPLVPMPVRLALRGWLTRRKRERFRGEWPILAGSERRPKDWPGWPGGKKFAFVLTHDVEGPAGVAKCRQMMEVEKKHGFHSSFNFIPEGGYRVTREFREEVARNGFEASLHDLYHNGRLYLSRAEFAKNAVRINQHLRDWGARGFRSGFMFHNLEWLQDLEIEYDASTFDTDPFEPQPDGAETIFPFWYQDGGGRGYVELPYTLPQDSTLFLLLRERTPSIWMEKTAWIADHGGMALLNVHPDYVDFEGTRLRVSHYPLDYYERFLRHVAETYQGAFWNPLPMEMAAWYKQDCVKLNGKEDKAKACAAHPGIVEFRHGAAQAAERENIFAASNPSQAADSRPPRRAARPKRVCMIVYSDYEKDNRVMRYAEELARRGDSVEVLALRGNRAPGRSKTICGVQVFGIQSRAHKDERTRSSYLWPLLKFSSQVWALVTWRHLRRPYDLVHVHNMPDFLVFTAWFPRLTGAKVILDIHDIVPEFYASKFDVPGHQTGVKMLKRMERAAARFSDHVIISNHLWRDKFAARTGTESKCSVFVNNVNSRIFTRRSRTRLDDKFIIIFPGGLQWHQGLDIALRAFQTVSREVPAAEFHIYGDGMMKGSLLDLTRELGLEDKVRFFDPIPVREIVEVMANADLGIVPKRADSFGNEAYSTKIMEFMSLGIPVVVSSTKIDRFYFDDTVVRFFESGNVAALAAAILEMIRNPEQRQAMAARALEYAVRNSWDTRKGNYLDLVDSLLEREVAPPVS
jgi:glycosyltransferase involved in cell wall biosynthesis/peptidoglycan/xylan/chitin deacetylase (PgdA/CDA1 family)